MKKCKTCSQEKPEDEFYRSSNKNKMPQPDCKQCCREKQKEKRSRKYKSQSTSDVFMREFCPMMGEWARRPLIARVME